MEQNIVIKVVSTWSLMLLVKRCKQWPAAYTRLTEALPKTWHNVHSPQHTYMNSSYRSNRLGLSHWHPYAVRRYTCLKLYYCNMVEWFWWDSSPILVTNWFPSVLWHCWFGHLACKIIPKMCSHYYPSVWPYAPFAAAKCVERHRQRERGG